jgi:predicted membrane metal-binding protein
LHKVFLVCLREAEEYVNLITFLFIATFFYEHFFSLPPPSILFILFVSILNLILFIIHSHPYGHHHHSLSFPSQSSSFTLIFIVIFIINPFSIFDIVCEEYGWREGGG